MTTLKVQAGDFFRRGSTLCEIICVTKHDTTHNGDGYRIAYIAGYNGHRLIGASTLWAADSEASDFVFRDFDIEAKREEGFQVHTLADADFVLQSKYGTPEEVGASYLDSERTYHRSEVRNFLVNDDVPNEVLNNHDLAMLSASIHLPLKDEGGAISLFRNATDAKRGRRTTMKPGKAFRLMFPTYNDKSIATITEAWIELNQPRELHLHVHKSREAFRVAYDHDRAPYRNPMTTHDRKSIATSCMQHVGRDMWVDGAIFHTSVGEVYASGDFAIAYITDKDGLIAGRVVYSDVEDEPRYAGPAYGACEQSLDMLHAHLESIEARTNCAENWHGLRFLLIGGGDDPLAPYVDGDIGGNPSRCGKYIELEKYGGHYGFDGTDGYPTTGMYCEHCECTLHADEAMYTDWGPLCENCFDESFVHLDNGDVIDREDSCEVRTIGWNGGCTTQIVHIDEAVFCEELDQYWHIDDVTIDDDGFAHPTHLIPDDDNMEEAA